MSLITVLSTETSVMSSKVFFICNRFCISQTTLNRFSINLRTHTHTYTRTHTRTQQSINYDNQYIYRPCTATLTRLAAINNLLQLLHD